MSARASSARVRDADTVHAIPLPPDEHGSRVFDAERCNAGRKADLAACVTVPVQGGRDLVAFGSGGSAGRGHEGAPWTRTSHRHTHEITGVQVTAEFLDARRFDDGLRATATFCGAGLNIPGAVTVGDGDTIVLFNRGNAPRDGDHDPVNAMATVSWHELSKHLTDPEAVPPPALSNIQPFDLGTSDGLPLSFSDADFVDGPILYGAVAQDPGSGPVGGSALGVIAPDGNASWATLLDESGQPFRGKLEGLSFDPNHTRRVHFVVDRADEGIPSEMFTAELHGPWPLE